MKRLAFVLFNYFPYGGLQHDMLAIAQKCRAEGYEISIFTAKWEGPRPDAIKVFVLGEKGLTNIAIVRNFARQFTAISRQEKFAAVIGFNKIPGLDIYYAADVCFYEKAVYDHWPIYKLTPRFRHYYRFEKSVLSPSANTKILAISPRQVESFYHYYRTPSSRITLLSPGVGKSFIRPDNWLEIRSQVRADNRIAEDDLFILQIGSGYRTKGLSRSLKAVASLPPEIRDRIKFYIMGRGKVNKYYRLARKLKIIDKVFFLGGKKEIENYLFSADILLHPSVTESAGIVLLEAMAAGLPVICTDTCGYSCHVKQARSGIVLEEPFRQEKLNQELFQILTGNGLRRFSENAVKYTHENDIYSLHEQACSVILDHTGGAE